MKHIKISPRLILLLLLAGWTQIVWSQPNPDTGTVTTTKDSMAGDLPLSDSARAAFAVNAARGRDLFTGALRLENGGPSCISCHNTAAADLPEGGLLAKDLTHVYGRLGEGGIAAILGATPFPAMAASYKSKPLTTKEMTELSAFFKDVEASAPAGEPTPQYTTLIVGGTLGLTIWLGLIFGMYYKRKKASVKQAIYDRQIQY